MDASRYYSNGWDSEDAKEESRARKVPSDLPDFLRYAVPMQRPKQAMEKKMDVIHAGYARATYVKTE